MHWHRIRAVVLHAWHHMLHSRETWIDIGWFPVVNTLAIGGFSAYLSRQNHSVEGQFTTMAVVLWYILEVGNYSISVGSLWEIWARSFSSLFTSPLTISEFVAGQIIFSMFKQCFILALLTILTSLIFHISPLALGFMLPVYMVLLAIFGWAFGMFVFGLILRFGTGLQSLAWGLVYSLQPVIGIYYPVSMLPYPIQVLSKCIAVSYVFRSARYQVEFGSPLWESLGIALILDVVTFSFAYLFMRRMWNRARHAGTLARMEE